MANDNKAWYEDIIRKGTLRSSGMNEITENNPLDWTRLRVLEGGKLIPAMANGHIGAPSALDLDLLRDAAEKGNLFLYRMGEEYPHRLVDGVWYSTDPAIAEEKQPELKLPKEPEAPAPFTATLEDELRERHFDPDTRRDDLQDDEARRRYDEAVAALSSKQAAHDKAQAQYATAQEQYTNESARLRTAHESEVQAWEKRVNVFGNLSTDVKRAIRDEMRPRREEIQRNQEKQRAFAIDSQPLVNWYNQEFSKTAFQPGKGPNPTGNPMDWNQIRIWDGEKFARVVPEGHIGMPGIRGIQSLRDAVEKGNLYFYRPGAEYPQRFENGVWYDTDPVATQEQRPELNLPEAPKEPAPFTATLESELKARGFEREVRQDELRNDEERRRYNEAVAALSSKETAHQAEQAQYTAAQEQYQTQRTQLEQAHAKAVEAWEKRVGYYNALGDDVKQALQVGVAQRREEIRSDQERQHAAMDSQPLGKWYNNEFRGEIVQPSNNPELLANDGMDWSRIRIWDGQNFVRAVPEGHEGIPDAKTIQNLKNAAEQGNLFMYQRGDKYPSKWMGDRWTTMDRNWIESCKPQKIEQQKEKPERPKIMEPLMERATKGISARKVATNRFFARFRINVYKDEAERYKKAVEEYQKEKEEYDRVMGAYNNEMEARRNDYRTRNDAYRKMLADYDGLSPEQKAALEKDAQQRAEEIKRNKEVEKKVAEERLSREIHSKAKITTATIRIDAMSNQPDREKFLNQGGASLGQNAYDTIAPHGYALPFNSGITPMEAAALHIALAGSAQVAKDGGLSPLDAQQYGQMLDGVFGNANTPNWQYITAAYDSTNGYITAYESGNPEPLAKAMSEGMRNLINASRGRMNTPDELAGLAKLTGRIFDVMDAHPNLMEHCTLNQEEMTFARGIVNLGRIHEQYLDARMALTRMSVGAEKLSQQELNKHTANLLMGKMINSRLNREQQGLEQPLLVNSLGKGNGRALEVVQNFYQNDQTIQQFANAPQTGAIGDLDKRTQQLAHVFGNSVLMKPKESAQLRAEVLSQVKDQMKLNDREAIEAAKSAQQLENMERQQVRYLLAQQDDRYSTASLQDPVITAKLQELRNAREVLEAREARNLVAGKEPKRYELTDDLVQKEALERASVWELMRRENPDRWDHHKQGTEISEFAISRRLAELRAAQKQLGEDYELTGEEVVARAAANQALRAEQLRQPVTEMLQAQQVYSAETGIQPKPTDIPPLYRRPEVLERLNQLKQAKAKLGDAGKDLALNDMKVIQRDYKDRGVDPVRHGIVDVESLNEEQKKEYTERMEAMDFLKNVRGVENLHPVKDRYSGRVETAVKNLTAARQAYEGIEGAEKDLPLNHPKISAMYLYNLVKRNPNEVQQVGLEDVEQLSQNIQGKPFLQAYDIAQQNLQEIQGRNRQPEMQEQAQQQAQQQVQIQGIM